MTRFSLQILVWFFFLLLLVKFSIAQKGKIDSLQSLLPSTKGEKRIALLRDLTSVYGPIDLNKALDYGREGFQLAKSLNNKTEQAAMLYQMGKSFLYFNENDSGRHLFHQSLDLASSQNDSVAIGNAWNGIAYSFYGADILDTAITYAFIARKYMKPEQSPLDYSYNCQLLGVAYSDLGNLNEGIKYFKEGLKYAALSKDEIRQAELCTHLGSSYIRHQKYDEAEKWVKDALEIYKRNRDDYGIYVSYNALGRINYAKGDHNEAMDDYEKSLALSIKREDQYSIAIELNNTGRILLERGEYAKAFERLSRAASIAREIKSLYVQRVSYENLQDYYLVQKKFTEAVNYRDQYRSMFDSISNSNIARKVADMQVKYETEKKEKAIAQQKLMLAEKDARIMTQRSGLIGLIGALIILIGGGWLFYNRYRLRQKTLLDAVIIREQKLGLKAIIEAQDMERKRIGRDLHDDIAQQLVAFKFAFMRLSKKIVGENSGQKKLLDDLVESLDIACTDVRNISHVMAPRALEENGLIPALENLLRLSLDHAGIKHEFEHSGVNGRLKENVETGLYRITQELINNILKHSQATNVIVKLEQQQNELELKVIENGAGYDFEEARQAGSMGLFNILSRVNILNGSFSASRLMNSGMEARIRIPLAA